MKVFESRDGYLVRLVRGEEIHASVTAMARERGLRGGVLSGIGAVEDAVVGLYDLGRREYVKRPVEGIAELLSLDGNLSLKDGAPFLHAHAVLLTENFSLAGGHLFSARCAITVELSWTHVDLSMQRLDDRTTGLALLETLDPEAPGAV